MRLAVGTFHSLALNQQKRFSKTKPPRLISDGERMAVLRRCWRQHAPSLNFDFICKAIDASKSRVKPPSFSDPSLEAVYRSFQEVMASEGAMDFSDILLRAVHRMHDQAMEPLPVRWMLVDEGQDMDEVQMEWILVHGKQGVEITLVGDDDQSLYSFRHALGYTGLQEITFALSSTEITLPVNYRCAPNILAHAAKLIQHNSDRAPKKITAFKENIGELKVYKETDRNAEAAALADFICETNPGQEWMVLARTNAILDAAEIALVARGIKVLRSGGKSIWEHSIGALYSGLLRSIAGSSWTGIANALSFAGVQASEVNNHSTRTSGVDHILNRLDAAIAHAKSSDEDHRILTKLRMGMGAWTQLVKEGGTNLVIYGASQFLQEFCKEHELKLLKSFEKSLAKLKGTLAQRLNFITRSNEQEMNDKTQFVQLMTLHASKGLECDNVWIMGCEEGNLPHVDSTEEDERRLMYVGMTRAKNRLAISSAMEEGIPSRFIDESGLKDTRSA